MTYAEIREAAAASSIDTERSLLANELAAHGFNITRTAAALECGSSTLRRALERHPDLLAKVGGPGRPKINRSQRG